MSFLVVANFKSNFTHSQVESWLAQVKPQEGMVIAPAYPHLSLFNGFVLATQDVSPFPKGSYTGAVNAEQLKEIGVSYGIVGHSERRRYFHETAIDVANKVKELLAVGITPLVCMDESDVTAQFATLDSTYIDQCIYCYEPAGGLGGSVTAPLEQISAVQKQIGQFVTEARFIYGGSVDPNNLVSLLSLNLSGVLTATASLNPDKYLSMVKVSHGV